MNNCEWMSVILVPWLRFLELALILPKRDNKNKHNAQTLSRQRVISRSPKFHKFQRFLKFWNFGLSPETFLTGRIPDLKFYSFSVKFDCSDFKVDSNCRNVTLLIFFLFHEISRVSYFHFICFMLIWLTYFHVLILGINTFRSIF